MRVTVSAALRRVLADVSGVKDPTDREILSVLVERGRISWQELGRLVHMSANAAAERVRRLEQRGVIAGYAAVIDLAAVGRPLEATIDLSARDGVDHAELEAWLAREPAVVDAMHLTGPHDYLLHVQCRDAGELDELLVRMKRDAGVGETETRVVLRHLG